MRAGITARGLRGFWGASHSIGRVGVSISARVGSQHSAEQAAGRAAKAMASASPPYYFSADFINQHQYTLAAPKALQARSRSPLARSAKHPAAGSAPAKGLAGIGRPGSAGATSRAGSWPMTPLPQNAARKTGVQDRGRVAGVLGPHDADEIPGIPVLDAILDLHPVATWFFLPPE